MSREIKFRAWDIDNEQMCVVPHITLRDNSGVMSCAKYTRSFVFDEVILEQFTGLKDVNGRYIYEGDIVKWGHLNKLSYENPARIAEVKICPDIEFHSQVGVFRFGSFSYAYTTHRDLEVIGNIHENPELLEVQE